jgi:hypothetical protein
VTLLAAILVAFSSFALGVAYQSRFPFMVGTPAPNITLICFSLGVIASLVPFL